MNTPNEISSRIQGLLGQGHAPVVIGIDGRSASGKTTLARLLAGQFDATVVHTDDIAWWHSHFDWVDILVADVLTPLRAGTDLAGYRPPGWVSKERPGHLDYRSPRQLIVVEGVGSTQRRMLPHLDLRVWVDCDVVVARERGLARDTEHFGSFEEALADWESWQAAEVPFLDRERPWEYADVILRGDSVIANERKPGE